MSTLDQQLAATLPVGMQIPEPIKLLYEWIEQEGRYYDNKDGYRVGQLLPRKEVKKWWSKSRPQGGTHISFRARDSSSLGYWFGFTDRHTGKDISEGKGRHVLDRLCTFSQTGADGSMAAFWLGEDGKQRIVHLGSGSGSTLVCVLAEDAVDFLRLLAIGYEEICWNEHFDEPPSAGSRVGDPLSEPNKEFREWVINTFGVTIPETAREIVIHPSEMDDTNSEDLFFQWTNKHTM